jgi:hypothetical protein
METLIAWGLTTLAGSFIGSYLASYLKKKGENLATHTAVDIFASISFVVVVTARTWSTSLSKSS